MRVLIAIAILATHQPLMTRTWAGVPAGPYPVGFTVTPVDPAASGAGGVRVLTWRPVQQATAAMGVNDFARLSCPDRPAVTDCFPDLAHETGLPNDAVLSAAQLDALARERLHAGSGGVPIASRLPLIALAGTIASRGGEFISLAEALASRGFVVGVVVPPARSTRPGFTAAEAELAYQGLTRALAVLTKDPGVDGARVALAAWSFGGVPIALEAMTNPRVRALVSLDSAIRYQYGAQLIRASAAYRPDAFRGRVLSLTAGLDNPVPKDEGVLRAMTNARIETHVLDGLRHGDFSDLYSALPFRTMRTDDADMFRRRHSAMLALIAAFLAEAV